jgi:hypothetical protein
MPAEIGMRTVPNSARHQQRRKGFTRVELCALLSAVCLLGFLALPAVGRSRETKGVLCLENVGAIARACLLYAEDHGGVLPRNPDGGSANQPQPGDWATGWVDYTTSSANTDPRALMQLTFSGYLPNVNTYHCPADLSISAAQRAQGASHRVRSYSMNSFVGEPAATRNFFPGFRAYTRISHFIKPPPADLFVVLDEHPDSINDPVFLADPQAGAARLLDFPASYHEGAAAISFADGHGELKVWEPATRLAVRLGIINPGSGSRFDAQWLGQHAAARE